MHPLPFSNHIEFCKSLGEWQPLNCNTTGSIYGLQEWNTVPALIYIPTLREFFIFSTIATLSMIILPKFSKIKYINILPNLKINFYYLFIFGFLLSFVLSYYTIDWGRWIAINNVCFFMFLLSFQKNKTSYPAIFINNKFTINTTNYYGCYGSIPRNIWYA